MASHNHTIVRNVSGVDKFFGFLGERGTYLTAGADYAHPGNLFDRWMNDPIQFAALRYALEHVLLEVIQTPDNYYYDPTTTIVRRLGVDNGAVTITDPDYGSYSGAASTV